MRTILMVQMALLFFLQGNSQCMPDFSFNINGFTASFSSQSVTGQGIIVSYYWNFGDGSSSLLANPVHIYASPGIYMVQHSIQNNLGTCDSTQDMISKTVSILPEFYQVSLCPPISSTALQAYSFGSSYQWQVSYDSTNYSNLVAGPYYTGVLTQQLQLTNIPSSFTGYRYRCVTDGIAGVPYRMKFENNWTGAQGSLWSNAGNWSCNAMPDAYTDIVITTGSLTVDINATVRSLTVHPPAVVTVQPGITLTVLN